MSFSKSAGSSPFTKRVSMPMRGNCTLNCSRTHAPSHAHRVKETGGGQASAAVPVQWTAEAGHLPCTWIRFGVVKASRVKPVRRGPTNIMREVGVSRA
eukprot:6245696-Pyramimonas_sp.AAC.1